MSNALPIRPEEYQTRAALRGCRNCSGYDGSRCRRGSPGSAGWPAVEPSDWCDQWQWAANCRVTWGSAIAPAEFPGHPNHIASPHNHAVGVVAGESQSHTHHDEMEAPPF